MLSCRDSETSITKILIDAGANLYLEDKVIICVLMISICGSSVALNGPHAASALMNCSRHVELILRVLLLSVIML